MNVDDLAMAYHVSPDTVRNVIKRKGKKQNKGVVILKITSIISTMI